MTGNSPPTITDTTFRADLVPRWAKLAAWAAVLTTIPSITWRMTTIVSGAITGNNPCVVVSESSVWDWVYLLAVLPSAQLGAALLTIGLIRPWGEIFPRWIPVLGRRRIPVGFPVIASTLGSILFYWVAFGDFNNGEARNPLPAGCNAPGWEVAVLYAPMLLWPPLLLAVTWHYWRRRTTPQPSVD